MPEFVFELHTCRWVELHWPPTTSRDDTSVIVARQLGTKRRRWDVIVIECDAVGLRSRSQFGHGRLTRDLLSIVRNAPADWSWYQDALPEPSYPWQYVREAVHRAADRNILETRRRGNRIEIRRKFVYPEWVRRVITIENKPDLDASAAATLGAQIEYDVALAVADEVWAATQRTGQSIEPALFESIPVEAGILSIDTDGMGGEVLWHPRTLDIDKPGTRIVDRPTGGLHDQSAARFEYVTPSEKETMRLTIAERAYERGWRSYIDTMRPDCRHFHLRTHGWTQVPWCTAKDRCQTASECAGSCPAFEPEPPGWRTRGWPIHGGPGRAIQRVLQGQRDRLRP